MIDEPLKGDAHAHHNVQDLGVTVGILYVALFVAVRHADHHLEKGNTNVYMASGGIPAKALPLILPILTEIEGGILEISR